MRILQNNQLCGLRLRNKYTEPIIGHLSRILSYYYVAVKRFRKHALFGLLTVIFLIELFRRSLFNDESIKVVEGDAAQSDFRSSKEYQELQQKFLPTFNKTNVDFVDDEHKVFQKLAFDTLTSSVFQYVSNNAELYQDFVSKDKQGKCDFYFEILDSINQEWEVFPIKSSIVNYNRDFLTKSDFVDMKVQEFKHKAIHAERERRRKNRGFFKIKDEPEEDIKPIVTKKQIDEFEKEYIVSMAHNKVIEQQIIDGVEHLRIYGSCYSKQEKESSRLQYLEKKLFPWLSDVLPEFTRWDGTTIDNQFPTIETNANEKEEIDEVNSFVTSNEVGFQFDENEVNLPTQNDKDKKQKQSAQSSKKKTRIVKNPKTFKKPKGTFIKSLRNNLKGRGIVITASDSQLDDAKNLIKILRAWNNELPIQVVHQGDLSLNSQKELVEIARDSKIELPKSYLKVDKTFSNEFKKQEIWFVDVGLCIKPKYLEFFQKFANKLLATFFNSFQEMILMDLDVIPFIKPEDFFDSPEFKRSGTFFFKDREIYEKQREGDSEFFQRLFPNELDSKFFNINKISNKTLGNKFIKYQYVHFMEAGVVVLNKTQHLAGLFETMQLQLYEPSSVRVWGDKELFWLGLAISGDENYEFNEDSAYAIGQMSSKELRFSKSSRYTNEVCSSHPGHISSEKKLLWMNSGFKNCKNLDTYEMDSKSYKYKKFFKIFNDEIKLQKKIKYFYNLPTRIEYAILPTVNVRLFRKSIRFKYSTLSIERTWRKRAECLGYLWCGYLARDENLINGSTNDGDDLEPLPEYFHGKLIEFDNETRAMGEYLGDLWISNYVKGYKLTDDIEIEADEKSLQNAVADD